MNRQIVFDILLDFYKNNSYLNLKLKQVKSNNISSITNRVYGVITFNDYLDYLVNELVNKQKIDLRVRVILKMFVYEYIYLNKKEHIIVNEAVNLSNIYTKSASGFINVNLRNINKIKDLKPSFTKEEKNEEIILNTPRFILRLLKKQYQDYNKILSTNLINKPNYIYKVNDLEEDIYQDTIFGDIKLTNSNVIKNNDFNNNNYLITDIGSYFITQLVSENKDSLLDMCSAPGTKSIMLKEKFNQIDANDIHPHRVNLIKDNLQKYNVSNINMLNVDASTFNFNKVYDYILIDAPCSGLGVIRSKPDIKYNITLESINELKEIQYNLLVNASKYLKRGGKIIYSTCTLNKEENEDIVLKFMNEFNFKEIKEDKLINIAKVNKEDVGITLKNYILDSNSFYCIKMERNE
ncbi:MAG: transcription antitermination factor NusB [Mycoplasmatales bacterium]